MIRYKDPFVAEVGIEVATPIDPMGRVVPSSLPAGHVVMAVHVGPYSEREQAYTAIGSWCRANALELAGPRWEIYSVPDDDAAALKTEVYSMVKRPPTLCVVPYDFGNE
jgi:effector-binding domain-containing protein